VNGTTVDASIALGTPHSSDGGQTWTIPVVTDTAFSDHTGSLLDGVYRLRIKAEHVNTPDGPMAADFTSASFHRLFGDINGTKNVNASDYNSFRTAFGGTSGDAAYKSAFDFDDNGVINAGDFNQIRARFGKSVTYTA
jgi:hypothetical protein